MERIERTVAINAPIEKVFHFHDDTKNLLKITPPNIHVTIETMGQPGLGYEVTLKIRQFLVFVMRWKVKITAYQPPRLMVDEQIRGPFKFWKQTRLINEVNGVTELTDIVEYEAPFGILGRIANALLIRRQVEQMFTYRQATTKRLLESM
ncbi:MAG: SRPBCC family protein [Candidatus Kapabacteria bacterium]|nr:SRPBCC family protein [Candidatus Kapabacteria bacterium]